MVKIIKEGKLPADIFRGTCRNCKSELEASRSEVKNLTWDQREGGELGNINCPVCSMSLWVYKVIYL